MSCFSLALFGQNTTAVLSAVSCGAASATGWVEDACTVTLNGPAPAGGTIVSLSSSNTAAVTVPSSVTVPANATSAPFAALVDWWTQTALTDTLTASAGSVSTSFNIQVLSATRIISISAPSMSFGNVVLNTAAVQSLTLTSAGNLSLAINAATLTGAGFTVSSAALPVTLNPGQAVTLSVQFDPSAAGAVAGQLTIASGDNTGSATKVVNLSGTGTQGAITPALSALSCSSASETGSAIDSCTVTLTAAASSGGLNVSLSSSSAAVAVPATVTVPANATSAAFTASVSSVGTAQAVSLIAKAGSVSENFALQLNAAISTLSINVTGVAFGNVLVNTAATPQSLTLTSTGTMPVTISAASLTGTGFAVTGTTLPVTLNPGQAATLSVQFDPTATGADAGQLTITSNSSTNSTAVIALSGTGTATAVLSALSCSNASMTGSGTDACTVTLSAPAASGGLSVGLSSSSTAVTVPATVVVPANATSAAFTATVSSVAVAQGLTVTAAAGSVSKSFALQLNAAVPTLSINATTVAFGDVALNTPATQSVTLTSTGTAPVTIGATTLTGAGFLVSGATFPVTLNAGQAVTLSVEFDPTVVGAATGQLTVTSNSSTNSTAVIALSGTGGTDSYAVDLTWVAPSSPSDPIAGYNVYRSPSGGTSYQLLNSSVNAQTTYVDTTVQSGQTYDYIVESVDDSGVESVPSNMFSVLTL